MVFINLENTYDKVLSEVLWRYLEAIDVRVTYTRAVKDVNDKVNIQIRIMEGDSRILFN